MGNKINLSKLANHVQALSNSQSLKSEPAISFNEDAIEEICKALPHGSGIDGKCEIVLEKCKQEKLVFEVDYRHMDEHGGYDGWTTHFISVVPSFIGGFTMKISGRNKGDIKNYLYDVFSEVFTIN